MPIISMGDPIMGANLNGAFSIPQPRNYRGRSGVAVPGSGIILKAARGGTAPVTHTVSNLPSGLSFNSTTRAITGTPIAVHASRAVVFTATDSSTPAEVVTATFQFPVVSATAGLQRDDFDGRGYGADTRTVYLLALLQGTVNVGGSDAVVWRRPPQTGSSVGLLLDDAGDAQTDLSDMTFTAGGETALVDLMTFLVTADRVELRESDPALHFGSYVRDTLGSPSLYLQTLADGENAVPFERGFGANAQFRRSSPDLGAFLQSLDSGVQFLLGVAST